MASILHEAVSLVASIIGLFETTNAQRRILSKLSQRELWAQTAVRDLRALRLDKNEPQLGCVEATGLGIASREKVRDEKINCQDDEMSQDANVDSIDDGRKNRHIVVHYRRRR